MNSRFGNAATPQICASHRAGSSRTRSGRGRSRFHRSALRGDEPDLRSSEGRCRRHRTAGPSLVFAKVEHRSVVDRAAVRRDRRAGLLCRGCGSRRGASWRPDSRRPASTLDCPRAAEWSPEPTPVNGHRFLPSGGHLIPRWWPSFLPAGGHRIFPLRLVAIVSPHLGGRVRSGA